jgi:hypothetical protein
MKKTIASLLLGIFKKTGIWRPDSLGFAGKSHHHIGLEVKHFTTKQNMLP